MSIQMYFQFILNQVNILNKYFYMTTKGTERK